MSDLEVANCVLKISVIPLLKRDEETSDFYTPQCQLVDIYYGK